MDKAPAQLLQVGRVRAYDGQFIHTVEGASYELGTYLGGGASGVVYEGVETTSTTAAASPNRFAVKILHPIGFKTTSPASLAKYSLIAKDLGLNWLQHDATKDVVVCGADGKELNVLQCTEIFGMDPASLQQQKLPPKYAKYLDQRALVLREITCMQRAAGHENVLACHRALEYVQETKSTFFLLLELATGGELFDRISVNDANSEADAKKYFRQLVRGVNHLHDRGICHRDLKPENLLLDEHDVLKIADFGLSNWYSAASPAPNSPSRTGDGSSALITSPLILPPPTLERFSSVVGSSHYTAPEILNREEYDGRKADAWSLGVILYALLCGSLPFAKTLATCERYKAFCKEMAATSDGSSSALRDWFLPKDHEISDDAIRLLLGLLHPDPVKRFSVKRAAEDVWLQPRSRVSSPTSNLTANLRAVPSFQSPPLAPSTFAPSSSGGSGAMDVLNLDEGGAPPNAAAAANKNQRRISLVRARSTSPPRVKSMAMTPNPKPFVQHTRRSTRFTTTVPAPEILQAVERAVLSSGLCARVEMVEEFKMQLFLADGRALGTVQVFLSRKKTRAVYLVEFVRAQLGEIFEFKLFYRELLPLLKTSLKPEAAD